VNSTVSTLLAFAIAKAAIDSTISIGAVLSFLFLLGRLQWPFVNISSTWGTIQNAFGSADRVFKVLDTETENYQTTAGALNENDKPAGYAIQIENINFSYDNNELFNDFSLQIGKGETVGIVGSSGSGKTTLAKLCCGLFLPDEGEVRIMGHSVKSSLAEARKQLSYVAQTPYILTGTVGENIHIGCPKGTEYSEEIILPAARMANADSFIEKLDEGYNTHLKENGSNISGGQKQRINIARALAKDAPIIIFDEATSSLDNESEMLIQETINSLMGSKTLIVIAHRLTTVQNLSRIIVLDQGRIAEEGTHEELLRANGMYHSLWCQGAGDIPSL
jgi:ATP-binding cassette subfamily B protein/subfamily B ATP-binding cassette protein MsbA